MEMENGNLPWKQVTLQLTRILDAGRKERFPPMDWHGISVSRLPAAGAATITMPLGWGLTMEMENGGGVRGSLPTQLGMREAQPCIGAVFGDLFPMENGARNKERYTVLSL